MAIIREDRINNENIFSIDNIEEYINTNYLQVIQDKIEDLNQKRILIEDKITLYNELNNANTVKKNALLTNSKLLTITNNQTIVEPLLDELNSVLKILVTMLSYKDIVSLNNLNYKQDLYGINKVDIVEGEFLELRCPNPTTTKNIVNKDYFEKELTKIEQPPKPLKALHYLTTDNGGNLQWNI